MQNKIFIKYNFFYLKKLKKYKNVKKMLIKFVKYKCKP